MHNMTDKEEYIGFGWLYPSTLSGSCSINTRTCVMPGIPSCVTALQCIFISTSTTSCSSSRKAPRAALMALRADMSLAVVSQCRAFPKKDEAPSDPQLHAPCGTDSKHPVPDKTLKHVQLLLVPTVILTLVQNPSLKAQPRLTNTYRLWKGQSTRKGSLFLNNSDKK